MLRKNNQLISILILIPMLVLSFVWTIVSEASIPKNVDEEVIYNYFYYKNEKDVENMHDLLTKKDEHSIESLSSDLDALYSIKIIKVEEEESESIKEAYISNNHISEGNLKVFNVKYEVIYNEGSNKQSGVFESWFFLTRESEYSTWLIDIIGV